MDVRLEDSATDSDNDDEFDLDLRTAIHNSSKDKIAPVFHGCALIRIFPIGSHSYQ